MFNKDCTALIAYTNAKSGGYIIPDSVTKIASCAFACCLSLTNVVIPGNVKKIGFRAFIDCISLTSVYYNCEDPIEFDDEQTFDYDDITSLYVPEAAVEKCKITSPWKYFKNIEAYDFSGVETVSGEAEKIVTGRYDISGTPVDEDYKGLVILQYSDGSNQKIIQK